MAKVKQQGQAARARFAPDNAGCAMDKTHRLLSHVNLSDFTG